ncbi:unnamed protein product [Leuciscus chuanchicus]
MFLRAGEKALPQPRAKSGLLTTATDWQLEVDHGKQIKIPTRIISTWLHPDMIIVSDSTKQLILLELTVPWEERMDEANERERAKYQELAEECRRQGWHTRGERLEAVVCRRNSTGFTLGYTYSSGTGTGLTAVSHTDSDSHLRVGNVSYPNEQHPYPIRRPLEESQTRGTAETLMA